MIPNMFCKHGINTPINVPDLTSLVCMKCIAKQLKMYNPKVKEQQLK